MVLQILRRGEGRGTDLADSNCGHVCSGDESFKFFLRCPRGGVLCAREAISFRAGRRNAAA